MTERGKWAIFAVCSVLLVLGVLVLVGVTIGSAWATFVPDLIIGVVGAGAIGLLLFALQQSSDQRRAIETDVSAAYLRVLDALSPLRVSTFRDGDADLLVTLNTRLLQLYESVLPDAPAMGVWFEAERQMGLYHALKCNDAVHALPKDAVAEARLTAAEPFLRWVAELSHNIRFWRTGNMTVANMTEQAQGIERILRDAGVWREKTLPWRDDV
jgi:hypothetical protein